MNNLRRSHWTREVSRVLILLLALPPLLLSLSAKPAAAQSTVKTVAVMDFDNLAGRQGFALGRKAADAVFLQLDPAKFDFVDREEVQTWIATLGLTPPLDRSGLLKLGAKLAEVRGLEQVITGRVLKATVSKSRPRQAFVEVEIRLLDVTAGEFVNGARGQGASSPRYDDVNADVLIDEAMTKAAFNAVTRLVGTTMKQGSVLLNKNGQVMTNLGAQDGIVPGTTMIVLRQRQKVGRIVIDEVTNRDSTGHVTEELRGITPEDIVQPIYTGGEATAAKPRGGSGLTKFLGIIGAGLMAYFIIKLFKEKDPQNVAVYAVRATSTLTANSQPAVHVQWVRPASPAPPDLVGYRVYRSDTQFGNYILVQQVNQPYETQYYDTTSGSTVNTSTTNNNTNTTTTTNVAGVQPGVTYFYRVARGFYLPLTSNTGGNNNNNNNNNNAGGIVWSDMSEPTPGVTPLNMARLQSPASGEAVNTSSITFRWFSVLGGDVYRIQVSSSPNFDAATTWSSVDNDPQMLLPGGIDNQLMSATWNVSSRFPMTNAQGQANVGDLFWRVGVRRSTDGVAPEGGFIYSTPIRITLQPGPPPPP